MAKSACYVKHSNDVELARRNVRIGVIPVNVNGKMNSRVKKIPFTFTREGKNMNSNENRRICDEGRLHGTREKRTKI